MNVRVNLNYTIYDGAEIVFKAPCDASEVTGLIVYYPNGTEEVSSVFAFADAHVNDLGNIDDLFVEGAVVKVILDTDTNMAFVQNAATNAYLERRFAGIGGSGSVGGAVLYTKQDLTPTEQAQARNNMDAAEAKYVYDYCGNMLPLDRAEDSYTKDGVTVDYKDGVFTFNGTATATSTVIEILDPRANFATIKAGEPYTIALVNLGGEKTGTLNIYLNSGVTSYYQSDKALFTKNTTQEMILDRFAFNFKQGTVFTDYKVAPYLGQTFPENYTGITKRNVALASEESVEELAQRVSLLETPFPTMFTDEKNRVIPIVQSESADLRLIAFADPHSTDANKYKKYNELLASGCVDGIIGLGDFNDYGTGTREGTLKYITEMVSHAGRTPNCFYVVGNHDIAFKAPNTGVVTQDNILTKKEMHDCLGRHLNGVAHFNPADTYGGYYYVDYDAAKIRMIMLNTSDIYEEDGSLAYKYTESVMIQQPQVDWFVNEALDFSNKTNHSGWSVLVCCHAALFIRTMVSEILAAFKSGAKINKSWTFKRRLEEGTTTVDQNNPVTITANKDYSEQGEVDVIGVLYGHDHNDVNSVVNGIQFIGFICDNAHLDDYYVKQVDTEGLAKQTTLEDGETKQDIQYYITTKKGFKFGFTLYEDVPGGCTIGYNEYLASGVDPTNTTLRIQDENGVTLRNYRVYRAESVEGMTEITGFVQERTPGTIEEESCMIVNIDKNAREIRIVPYGVGENRVISY